ncbi:hypothetical protein [Chondrinema litorale]|uniref:hypothetical protein n=1 Tax=Chondrinema litorale TaxID=2994555 RepID=UPI00254383A0|nr:hypothetical protein [Chondrinema litorale]UZR95852.1 hypothetical protein OQ292_08500 [Chondrinema litorale]
MKPKIIIPVLLILAFAIVKLKQIEEKKLEAQLIASKEDFQQIVNNFKTPEDYINSLSLSEIEKANWKVYSEKFNLIEDSYLDTMWFTHKNFLKENDELILACKFNDKGNLKLISHYTSTEPLQHYQIQLVIENQVFDSSMVLSAEKPFYKGEAVSFTEEVAFDSDKDIRLLEKIAENSSSEIMVRLIGNHAFKEYVLSENMKLALKDSWSFAKLMNNKI